MSVRISESSVVVRTRALDAAGGVHNVLGDATPMTVSSDGELTSIEFAIEEERNAFAARLRAIGFNRNDLVEIERGSEAEWLDIDATASAAWLRESERGELAMAIPVKRERVGLIEHLSRSDSGLHYVRERKSGLLRSLTEDELQGFSDPPPCEECGEQFGCEHYNCARERLLGDAEVDREAPAQWRPFAREHGISREDIDRLATIRETGGEYSVAPGAASDMRTQELVILLNESR